MDATELNAEVSRLQAKAKQHEDEQAKAQVLVERYRFQLEQLQEQLETTAGTSDWTKASDVLRDLQTTAAKSVTEAARAMREAGIDV